MRAMTTDLAPARRYRVFIKTLRLGPGLDGRVCRNLTFVDAGLTAEDLNTINRPELSRPLLAATLASNNFVLLLATILAACGFAGYLSSALIPWGFALVVVAASGSAACFFRGEAYLERIENELNEARSVLTKSGRMAELYNISARLRNDPFRIDDPLSTLQARFGSVFDDEARAVVTAVLRQDSHEPSKR
jgi:hypothetical protein